MICKETCLCSYDLSLFYFLKAFLLPISYPWKNQDVCCYPLRTAAGWYVGIITYPPFSIQVPRTWVISRSRSIIALAVVAPRQTKIEGLMYFTWNLSHGRQALTSSPESGSGFREACILLCLLYNNPEGSNSSAVSKRSRSFRHGHKGLSWISSCSPGPSPINISGQGLGVPRPMTTFFL